MARLKPSTARRIGWSIGITSIALFAAALVILFIDRHAVLPSDATRWSFGFVRDVLSSAATSALGIVLTTRRPHNRLGWLFLTARRTWLTDWPPWGGRWTCSLGRTRAPRSGAGFP